MFCLKKGSIFLSVFFALMVINTSLKATPVVMGYWENWGTYYGYSMPGSTIPNETMRGQLTGLNALAYAFLETAPDGSILFTDVWADLSSKNDEDNEFCEDLPQSCPKFVDSQGGIGSFKAFLKTPVQHVISIGGAGHDATFENAFDHPEQFLFSLKVMQQYFKGIDWIDLDYEPVNGIPEKNIQRFADLIKRIKMENPNLKLSYTFIANHNNIKKLGKPFWKNISQYLDYLGVMGYDMHGAFDFDDPKTALHAPLYSTNDDFSVDKTIQTLISLEVEPSKILLGMPMYGRAVAGVNEDGLGVPFSLSYKGDIDESKCNVTLGTSDMCSGVLSYKNLISRGYINKTRNNYFYDPSEKLFVSYDNPATVKEKAQYVNTQGLGGVFFWALRMDKKITHPQSLLAAVDTVFGIPFYQPERLDKPKLYSYWAGWSNVPIPDLRFNGLVLAFAFLEKGNTGQYYSDYSKSNNFQNYSETGPYATWQIKWLKKFYPQGSRAYLSYGGGTNENIRGLVIDATPEQLSSIAGEIKANVKKYYFDGVDLDIEFWWKYNKTQNKKFAKNLVTLVKLLRESLDNDPDTRNKPIMIAVGGDSAKDPVGDAPYTGTMKSFYADSDAMNAISGIFIMSYDLQSNINSIATLLNSYTDAGVPEEKLFVGVSPFGAGQVMPLSAVQALGEFVKKNNYGGLFVWAIGSEGLDTASADKYLRAMKTALGLD